MNPFAEYEAAIDAAPLDVGDADPGDVTDPAPAAAAEPAAVAEPSWAGPSQEEWEQTQYLLSQIAQQAQQPAPAAQTAPEANGPPDLDPFDPESVRAYQDWRDQQLLGQIEKMVTPLSERAQQEQQAEQASLLKDAAHDVETRKGEFLGDETARSFAQDKMLTAAREAFPQFAARYGPTDRAAELALEHAHSEVKAWEASVVKAGIERHTNELATLAGAPNDPTGGGTGVHQTPQVKGDEMDFARHYAARA